MKQLIYVLSISLFLVSCQMNNGAKPGTSDMSAKNVATAKIFYDKVMNGHSTSPLDSIIADSYNEHTPDPMQEPGKAGLKKDVQGWLDAFPDQNTTVNSISADSNTVTVLWSVTGTNSGPLGKMPATNKKISVSGLDLYKFDKTGKISDHWGYMDQKGFFQQMGWMPSDSVMMAMQNKPMDKKDMKKK